MNPQQDIYNMTVNSPHKESLIIKELILNIIKSTNQNQVTVIEYNESNKFEDDG